MKHVAMISFLILALGCGGSSTSNTEGDGGRVTPTNRVEWDRIPEEFNPKIDENRMEIEGFEKIALNIFGFESDVEVIYSKDIPAGKAHLKIYKVWKKQASWGSVVVRPNGRTLEVNGSGNHQCSIRVSNGQISELEGGCFIRIQLLLPVEARVEVYNLGKILTRRFFVMDTETFLKELSKASWDKDKYSVIENYLASYKNLNQQPSMTSAQLGTVIGQFIKTEDKYKVLEQLHLFVSDRSQLAKMIDSKFTYFEREEARRIVGL